MKEVLKLLVFGFVLCVESVESAPIEGVTLTFNGTTITGPILIYHDEIVSDTAIPTDENSNGPGDLVCRSASVGRTFWRTPTGNNVPSSTSGDFYQVRTPQSDPQTYPFLARLSTIDYLNSTDSAINGLWICPLGLTGNIEVQDVIDGFIYVGIFSRNSGFGVINTSSISLVGPSFMADPPSFTLIGDTTGGPPETSTWTRNGVTISDGGSYSISLTVPGVTTTDTLDLIAVNQIFQQSRYRSTLTVTDNLPGVYVYSVINRAMSAPRTASFTIEGGVITNLTAEQTGLTTVQVTWTAPPDPPTGGYQITVAEAGIDVTGQESPYTFNTSELGVHTVQVMHMYTSQHFPNEEAVTVDVTVDGINGASITTSSLTATSVTISWSPQPAQFHLPVVEYTVSLTRVTGGGQVMDSRPAVTTTDTSMPFTGLEEFSTYTVTVTTTFNVFSSNMTEVAEMMFTTSSSAASTASNKTTMATRTRDISITAVVSSLMTIIVYTTVLLVGCGVYHSRKTNKTWSVSERTQQEMIYEEVGPTKGASEGTCRSASEGTCRSASEGTCRSASEGTCRGASEGIQLHTIYEEMGTTKSASESIQQQMSIYEEVDAPKLRAMQEYEFNYY